MPPKSRYFAAIVLARIQRVKETSRSCVEVEWKLDCGAVLYCWIALSVDNQRRWVNERRC